MTLAAGLTPSGFVAPTQAEILTDLNAQTLAIVGSGLDLSPDQSLGQLWGIASAQLAQAYEIIATIYNAMNPNAAEGALLVSDCALTGTVPQAATYSTVAVTMNLNAGVTANAGFTAYVAGQPTNTWVLINSVTNSGGSPANVVGQFRSALAGPFAANAGTLTQPSVTVIGLNSLTNPANATAGLAADTDTTLRARRALELTGQGNGDIDSIRSHLLNVLGVVSGLVTENTSLVTAGDGTPGKAFHPVLWTNGVTSAALLNAIAQAIWTSKPAGILSYGLSTGSATDALGNLQSVNFDLATQLPIYLQFTTTPVLSSAGAAALKTAILGYVNGTFDANGNELTAPAITLGQNVVALALKSAALASGLVTDVPLLYLNIGAYGTNQTNLAVTGTQIATFSTANMLVNGL
jgi:hypothetical protein